MYAIIPRAESYEKRPLAPQRVVNVTTGVDLTQTVSRINDGDLIEVVVTAANRESVVANCLLNAAVLPTRETGEEYLSLFRLMLAKCYTLKSHRPAKIATYRSASMALNGLTLLYGD